MKQRSSNNLDIEIRVKNVIAKVVNKKPEDISLDHDLMRDLAVDSIDAIECVAAIEEEFHLDALYEKGYDIRTIQDIVNHIKRKQG